MRALALLIAVAVATPAWAQIEEHASGAAWNDPSVRPAPGHCGWCVAAELGVSFAAMLAGGAIGFAINAPVHYPYGEPIWIGASLGLVAGSFAAAWVAGRFDDHPQWLGAFIGGLAGVLIGGGGALLCFAGLLATFSFNSSNPASAVFFFLGAAIAAVVPPLGVALGIEVARARRVSVGLAPIPGGGGAVALSAAS